MRTPNMLRTHSILIKTTITRSLHVKSISECSVFFSMKKFMALLNYAKM